MSAGWAASPGQRPIRVLTGIDGRCSVLAFPLSITETITMPQSPPCGRRPVPGSGQRWRSQRGHGATGQELTRQGRGMAPDEGGGADGVRVGLTASRQGRMQSSGFRSSLAGGVQDQARAQRLQGSTQPETETKTMTPSRLFTRMAITVGGPDPGGGLLLLGSLDRTFRSRGTIRGGAFRCGPVRGCPVRGSVGRPAGPTRTSPSDSSRRALRAVGAQPTPRPSRTRRSSSASP